LYVKVEVADCEVICCSTIVLEQLDKLLTITALKKLLMKNWG